MAHGPWLPCQAMMRPKGSVGNFLMRCLMAISDKNSKSGRSTSRFENMCTMRTDKDKKRRKPEVTKEGSKS